MKNVATLLCDIEKVIFKNESYWAFATAAEEVIKA